MRQAGSLSTRVLGEGPPIVLLHGLVGSGICWGAAYDQLRETRRLIVPDLLGFGRSARPARGYGPEDHARAVLEALDTLGVDEPAVVGAHSLGCLVGLKLAAIAPHRVTTLLGFGAPLYPDPDTARRRIGAAGPMARLFVLPGSIAEKTCRWVCDHRRMAAALAVATHPSLPPPIAADAVQHSWASYSETMTRVILSAQAADWLEQVTMPVHFVTGDRDRVVDRNYIDQLAATHDNVRSTTWRGGHDLPLRQAERCVALLREMAMRARSTSSASCVESRIH